MLQKLQLIKLRWDEVERELSNPEVMTDMKRYAQLNKEYKDLGEDCRAIQYLQQYHG